MTKQDDATSGVSASSALIDHLAGFREELARYGYGPVRSGAHLELFADLCGWLEREGVALADLASDRIASFLAGRRPRGRTDLISLTGVAPLAGYLVRIGAIRRRSSSSPRARGGSCSSAAGTTSRPSGASQRAPSLTGI